MAEELMRYELQGNVALLHLDDGKANAVNHAFIDAVHRGLDRAAQDARAVIERIRKSGPRDWAQQASV